MKKSLSFLLALAMVLTLLTPAMAFAATSGELTAGSQLKDLGVLKGDLSGDLGLDKEITRENMIVLLSRLYGVEDEAAAHENTHGWEDVTDPFYHGYISWAKEEGLTNGIANGFGYGDPVERQHLLQFVLRALGYTDVAYADVPAKAVELGLVAEGADMEAAVLGGEMATVTVGALNTNVNGSEIQLGAKLGLDGYVSDIDLTSAVQVGAKTIKVSFNTVAKAAPTLVLKKGFVPYAVTTTLNDDKTSATIEASFALTAGEYTVEAEGLTTQNVTVVAGQATKVELKNDTIQLKDGAALPYTVFNQFGEDMEVAGSGVIVNVFDATKGLSLASSAIKSTANGVTLDLATANNLGSKSVENNDQLVITVTHSASGLTASKTYTVVSAASAASIQLDQVSPLKDSARITVDNDGLVLPYTILDQYGNTVTLSVYTAIDSMPIIDGVQFMSSNTSIIDPANFKVDSDGVLTFKAGGTAGTVTITAINPSTGANAFVVVTVNEKSEVKNLNIVNPAALIVHGEEVEIPYTAVDSYGNPIAKKDLDHSKVTFSSSNKNVALDTDVDFYDENVLKIKATGTLAGTTNIYVYVDNILQNYITIDVKEAAVLERINAIDIPALYAVGGSYTVEKADVTAIDQYNRTMDLSSATLTVADQSGAAGTVTQAGLKLTGAAAGSEVLRFSLTLGGETKTFDVTVKTIADDEIKSYALDEIGTISSKGTGASHDKGFTIFGLDSAGKRVAVDQNKVTGLSSSDVTVMSIVGKTVHGAAAGTATLTAWNGATKLASIEVTVSDAVLVIAEVSFANDTESITSGDALTVTTKDQYGVAIASAGTWASSNSDVAVDQAGVVTGTSGKTATISYVSNTGVVDTVEVTIN